MKTNNIAGIIAIIVIMGTGFGCVSTTTTLQTVDVSTAPRPTPDIEAEGPCPSRPDPNALWLELEMLPELIYCAPPQYPRLAEQAGLEGTVWIQVCVGKQGSVLEAILYRSSGTPTLDEAALHAAYWNRFKPVTRNGRPLCTWVPYKVEFKLD